MLGAKPLTELIRLELPDRTGPYKWRPESLQEPGVRLVRLVHNGVTQPRKRKDVESVQDGAWTYRVMEGEITWSCYEWLAPKTHKLKIEIDRTAQAVTRLIAWLQDHPDVLEEDDPLGRVQEGYDDPWVRKLVADPGFSASFALIRLLAAPR